jgi:hypothetical protein
MFYTTPTDDGAIAVTCDRCPQSVGCPDPHAAATAITHHHCQPDTTIRRQLPPGSDPDLLVFTGPGGGNSVPAGTRTMLSRDNFRRVYQHAVARAGHDPVAVDPHSPHDLRHTFSSWLEDAGIPARVIYELMAMSGAVVGSSRAGVASGRAIATPRRRWPSAWPQRSRSGW